MLLSRHWTALGFAARLTCSILLLLVLAIGLLAGTLYQHYKNAQIDARLHDLQTQSETNAQQFTDWLLARQDEIRVIAQTPAAEALHLPELEALLMTLAEHKPLYDSIYIVDTSGQGLAGVMQEQGRMQLLDHAQAASFQVADRDWFRAAIKGQEAFSQPVISRSTGNLVSTIAIPIVHNQKVIGVARGAVKIDTLMARIGELAREPGTEIYLIDQHTGRAITPAASIKNMSEPQTTRAFEAIRARQHFTGIYANAAADTVVGSSRFIPLLGWGLVVEQVREQALREVTDTRNLIVLLTLAVLAVAAGICLLLVRAVTRLLGGDPAWARHIVQQVAEGNLAIDIALPEQDHDSLLRAIARMQTNLRRMLGDITQYAEQVAAAATELAAINAQSAQAIEEQSTEINNSAAAMNEMSAALDEVARNTQSTASASVAAQSAVRAGNQTVDTSRSAISALADEVTRASVAIDAVKADSDKIDSVMEVIKSIAEQTNLLALNAAIEAARAGDSGRGFAVVADEVRGLAIRTKESTSEIQAMIEKLQQGSAAAVGAMQISAAGTQTSVALANETGQSLATILQAVKSIDDTAHQIASATEQQTQVAREINQSIHTLSSRIEETAEHVQQSSSASESLAYLASSLKGLVTQFKV